MPDRQNLCTACGPSLIWGFDPLHSHMRVRKVVYVCKGGFALGEYGQGELNGQNSWDNIAQRF